MVKGTYLWDYDLPSYSHRAGDTSGYYLLSQVRDADREALGRVLEPLPGGKELGDAQVEQILLEVARRGIPTIRGLSGDDTGATGDLGLFLAVRLLQDQFRVTGNADSLLPVLSGSPDDASIAIIIPVDPFRGYLADLAKSLGKERKDASLSRPDSSSLYPRLVLPSPPAPHTGRGEMSASQHIQSGRCQGGSCPGQVAIRALPGNKGSRVQVPGLEACLSAPSTVDDRVRATRL